jgi:hypothetical protein
LWQDFQFHTQDQQALGWEQNIFSRPRLIPFLSLSSSMGNLRVFLRFLLIASLSSSDSFVTEDEELPLSGSFSLVLGWIGQDCGDASLHDFVPPSRLQRKSSVTKHGSVRLGG